MIFRVIVMIGERILGKPFSEDGPRADMFLPVWLLAMGMALVALGAGALIVSLIIPPSVAAIIVAAAGLAMVLFGAAALLCWRNQTIVMLSEDEFEYTTFLGSKRVYRFDDITHMRVKQDSLTLFVRGDKVHIESSAIMSRRLITRLDIALGDEEEDTGEDFEDSLRQSKEDGSEAYEPPEE